MPEAKTKPTTLSVDDYIAAIPDLQRQADCRALVALMTRVTGSAPLMWGSGIVGFDRYQYRYASGHSGESCLTGFSSRKGDISIYTQIGFDGVQPLLARLGRHKLGKACLYLRCLADVDLGILEQIVAVSISDLKKHVAGSGTS